MGRIAYEYVRGVQTLRNASKGVGVAKYDSPILFV